MYAILGVACLAASAIVFAWAYGQFRRPLPRRWTRSDLAGAGVSLILVALLTFGIGMLSVAAINIAEETRWLEIAAVTGVSLLLCWFLVPRLSAPARRHRRTAAAPGALPGSTPEPANDPHPRSPAQAGRRSSKPGKRRAA
jgi:ABC-type nickel/cobalt efflux system permease component RcnA